MTFLDRYINKETSTPLRINGETKETDTSEVFSPFNGEIVGATSLATVEDIDYACAVAKKALYGTVLPPHQRAAILDKAAAIVAERKEDFAKIISYEAAKPIKTARVEVERCVQTFLFSAAAARTFTGEMVALDSHPSGEGRLAFTLRVPIGVVAAIAPFNFPLNLVAHKIAPAIAAGCPTVLKPAHNTPLSSATLVDMLIDECSLPGELLSYVPCPGDVAARFASNDDVAMISFTGSPGVGWSIKKDAAKKKVALELGNNAPVIVEADADIDKVAATVAASGYSFQGQSCISVQRVYVHESRYDAFLESLQQKVDALVVGDPLDDKTDVSALITSENTTRVTSWIADAVTDGARVVTGATLTDDHILRPTILADTTDDMDVCRKEVFGPVVSAMKYSTLDEALTRANNTSYGLQAAIYTTNIASAMKAAHALDFAGVLINESPTYRADNMPYGGIRDSGNTREGPAYTIKEMTEKKLVIINES
jgi:acyl-CoA reductase-like NAD-dependent aldehyde dehydrogenase